MKKRAYLIASVEEYGKLIAFCMDIHSTRVYLNKKIKERETLELHRDT